MLCIFQSVGNGGSSVRTYWGIDGGGGGGVGVWGAAGFNENSYPKK